MYSFCRKETEKEDKKWNEHHTSMEDQLQGVDRRLSPGLREEVNGVVLLRGGHELREEVQTSIQWRGMSVGFVFSVVDVGG